MRRITMLLTTLLAALALVGVMTAPAGATGSMSLDDGDGDPFGFVDRVSADADSIGVAGWAIDPDTTAAIDVRFFVDGQFVRTVTADAARPDVGAAYPAYGSDHGFAAEVPAASGERTLCAQAVNVAGGPGDTTACRSVTVASGEVPFGNLDLVDVTDGDVLVAGWAIDPDTTAPVDVAVHVDGTPVTTVTADAARPDVAAVHPAFGPRHGFGVTLSDVPTGTTTVCAHAVDVGAPATDTSLGCQEVHVEAAPFPTASLDVVVTHPDVADMTYEIDCRPDSATVSGDVDLDAPEACRALGTEPVTTLLSEGQPEDRVCAQVFGGPHEARITGDLEGQVVDVTVTRTDACEIDDWDVVLDDVLPEASEVTG